MGLTVSHYLSSKPGVETTRVQDQMRVDWSQSHIGGFPAFRDLAEPTGNWLPILDLRPGVYVAANAGVTETKDNSGTIAVVATTGKLRFQTTASPTDNDDIAINGSTVTPLITSGKWYKGYLKVQVSSAANYGLIFGLVTAGGTEYFTAAPADGIYFIKAKNAATIVGRVVENSNAADDSATLATLSDATDIELGFSFKIGTSAADTVGYWEVNGTRTAFTANQLDALYKIYGTTQATLCAHLGCRVNSTTQRNAIITGALIGSEM